MLDEIVKNMEYIRLSMFSRKLLPPDDIIFPDGYSFRLFQNGDEHHWSRITYEADEFDSIDEALNFFNMNFVGQKEKLYSCCFFCCNNDGIPIGTSTAWSGEMDGFKLGMLSWVVISKEYQGRGLCKPLVGLAVQKISQEHNSAFLHTQTTSYKGIKVYLDMGFEPYEQTNYSKKGWNLVWKAIKHPKLADFIDNVNANS